MKVKRKKVGYQYFLDSKKNVIYKRPNYKIIIEERDFILLIKNPKLYYSLIFPIITFLLISISTSKASTSVFSMLFATSLLPLIKTISEVFNIFEYANKDMAKSTFYNLNTGVDSIFTEENN